MEQRFSFEVEPFELGGPYEFEAEGEWTGFEADLEDTQWEGEGARRRRKPARRFGKHISGARFRPGPTFRPRPPAHRVTRTTVGVPSRVPFRFPPPPSRPRFPRLPAGAPLTVIRDRLGLEPPIQDRQPPREPSGAGGGPSLEPPAEPFPSGQGSEYVRWVQSSLNNILGLSLPLDGVMGVETRSAVRSFQEKQGLPPDGIVGPNTERALIEARKTGSPPSPQADRAKVEAGGKGPNGNSMQEEFEASSQNNLTKIYAVPGPVIWLLNIGMEQAAIKLAVNWGYRDENKLSNLVFFARFPQRQGRPLSRDEPDFPQLSKIWVDIRNGLVRPILQGAPVIAPASAGVQIGQIPSIAQPSITSLDGLRALASPTTTATVNNALAIMKIICAYHNLPWRVGFTILEHEGGVGKFKHQDGVMQTIRSARQSNLPLIPRPLKLAILDLPANDATLDSELTSRLHTEFRRRLAVQIAAGVQELKKNLNRFNGYVALAYQAYNAGSGWAYYTATRGKEKVRPKGIKDAEWERMCLEGATLLHRSPDQIRADTGIWQCDANMPGWFRHIPVFDRRTGSQLIAYKYLRSFVGQIRKNPPGIPCNQSAHRTRQQGSGPVVSERSRDGSLDKLYDPRKLSRFYYQAVQQEIGPLGDDGQPLKVENGQLAKKPAANL